MNYGEKLNKSGPNFLINLDFEKYNFNESIMAHNFKFRS